MAGYTASGRLQGAVPRFAGASPGRGGAVAELTVDAPPASSEPSTADQIELVGRPIDEAIREWLASIGESWAQLTFYLFDPESWR
ncbi:MAG TPA: hypothetical protein VFW02_01775 [Candidatus Limnocylindrales bacterium]|nr:hypothetical protein [Candidatus Limnocylindrales bacterium]